MTDDNKEDGGHGFDDTLPSITGSMKKIFSDVSSANAAAGEKFEKFLDAYHLKLKLVSDSDSEGSDDEIITGPWFPEPVDVYGRNRKDGGREWFVDYDDQGELLHLWVERVPLLTKYRYTPKKGDKSVMSTFSSLFR